jgi:hypothetical protein
LFAIGVDRRSSAAGSFQSVFRILPELAPESGSARAENFRDRNKCVTRYESTVLAISAE